MCLMATGLIERAADSSDGRAVRVLLTMAGEQVLARLSALHVTSSGV
ncbi:MAG: hypothetical protein ACRDRO_04600 [Pseudonocardiaceae bacterium]